MSGRFSKSEVDRLGERIRASDRLSVEDLRMLQAWRAQHADALDEVVRILVVELGLRPTSRLKTQDTLIDKLHRETIRLSQVQDIAGCRVEVDGGLAEQDHVVRRAKERFPDAKIYDRRERPSHGYRAVHVVVPADAGLVEVQVRTTLQNLWAQAMERIAVLGGRQVQYGLPPTQTEFDRHAFQGVVNLLMHNSQLIREAELQNDAEAAVLLRRLLTTQIALADEALRSRRT